MSRIAAKARKCILDLLKKEGIISASEFTNGDGTIELQVLKGDGSTRRFFRVSREAGPLGIAVLPGSSKKSDMAECRAVLAIGRHLYESAVPVPEILAVDESCGLILFEDLGDVRLHELIRHDRERGLRLYRETVKVLAGMQVRGAEGFNQEWCSGTPVYDRNVMLKQESGYFFSAFWLGTLFETEVEGLKEEFSFLANQAIQYFDYLFLHRDFQCRNIMICRDRVRIIDFQAGRLGPPGYDIASLLIDPYARLSDRLQADLFQEYLDEMRNFKGIDIQRIISSYPYLAVQRNLQIIGAFAFLSGPKGKNFFLPFILPSLIILQNRLDEKEFEPFPVLRKTVSKAILKYRSHMMDS